jgi:hypothetical protein
VSKGLTIKFELEEKRGRPTVIRKKRRELKIKTLILTGGTTCGVQQQQHVNTSKASIAGR